MIFDALYITDDETDAGTRQIVARTALSASTPWWKPWRHSWRAPNTPGGGCGPQPFKDQTHVV